MAGIAADSPGTPSVNSNSRPLHYLRDVILHGKFNVSALVPVACVKQWCAVVQKSFSSAFRRLDSSQLTSAYDLAVLP